MTTIKLKNGSGAPTSGDLAQGEPALDLTNKRLYTEDSGGSVIEVGTNPTSVTTGNITATGTATFAGLTTTADVSFGDSDKAVFGAGADLQIYHDGSNSYIDDTATGHLFIRSNGDGIYLRSNTNEEIAHFNVNGSVKAYYDNSLKLETTSTGIDITGTVNADSLTVDGNDSYTSNVRFTYGTSFPTYFADWGYKSDSDGNKVFLTITDGGSANDVLVANYDGNVGIGTNSPAYKAQISDSGNTVLSVTSGDSSSASLYLGDSVATRGRLTYDNSSDSLAVYTDNNERMRLDSSGRLLVGHTDSVAHYGINARTQVQGTGADTSSLSLTRNSNNNNPAYLILSKTRSTTTGGSGLVQNGDTVGDISFTAGDGVDNVSRVASIQAFVDKTASANDIPGRLVFSTTADGAQEVTERMRIDSSGIVQIGPSGSTGDRELRFETGSGSASGEDAIINSYRSNADLILKTNDTERMRIDSSGNTTFKTSAGHLSVEALGGGSVKLNSNGSMGMNVASGFSYEIDVGGTEAMRIDSNRNLLVGKTNNTLSNDGTIIRAGGEILVTNTSDTAGTFNRLSTDGAIIGLYKDGTTIGSIGNDSNNLYLVFSQANNIGLAGGGPATIFPVGNTGAVRDDAIDLGYATGRFDDIYATNGTIQTSDRNEKQDIEALSDAEQRVAVACKGLLRKFRWKSSVAENGDDARIHFGIIAQDLQAAFEAEGLDAGRYGMFINSTWTDEETGEERSRMGVRYSELLAFIIAAI